MTVVPVSVVLHEQSIVPVPRVARLLMVRVPPVLFQSTFPSVIVTAPAKLTAEPDVEFVDKVNVFPGEL